jgi:hypothetical protein
LLVCLAAGVVAWTSAARAQAPAGGPATVNMLSNASFELVEPPPPTAQTATQPTIPAEEWLPRTWNIYSQWGAKVTCPDDRAQAHTGSRCVHIEALKNQQGVVRFVYVPIPFKTTLTVRYWARGDGQLAVSHYKLLKDRWSPPTSQPPVTLSKEWKQYESQLELSEPGQYVLDIACANPANPTEAWIDDVFAGYPGMTTVNLPPMKELTQDKDTLLYLPFEKWFDEDVYFVKQKAGLSAAGKGLFGRSLVLGAQGYIACSANENLDCRQGTIEVWFKLLTPAADGLAHPIVMIPGMEGMWLGLDQYTHVGFSFSSGWRGLCSAHALGYANQWQPGVWRHIAVSWDKDLIEIFVDGKLVAWEHHPNLPRSTGPELSIGSPNMELDDLRISNVVRYRQPVPPPDAPEKK